MGKRKKRDLVALWRGKVSRVIGQGSDQEIKTLMDLVWHKKLTHEEKYLILEGAIFDVWSNRLVDREAEALERRQRLRQQAKAATVDANDS